MNRKIISALFLVAFSFLFLVSCNDDDSKIDPDVNTPDPENPIKDTDPTDPDPDDPDENAAVIDHEGGELASSDEKLLITVPEGVFTEPVAISIEAAETNEHPTGVGTMYELNTEVDRFDEPLTLRFDYDESLLPEGVHPELLTVVFRRDGESWMTKPNAVLDKTTKTIAVQTDHFSDWSLAVQGDGYIDIAIPQDTFQLNLPLDEVIDGVGGEDDYSDTLTFNFKDVETGYSTYMHKIGDFEVGAGEELTMFLSIRSAEASAYSGTVTVNFAEYGTASGNLVTCTITGEVTNPEEHVFPITGKIAYQVE